MSIGIICLVEGDVNKALPIRKDEESDSMAIFNSTLEAQAFLQGHILYNASIVLAVDLETGDTEWL
jgi:hypothetical protein